MLCLYSQKLLMGMKVWILYMLQMQQEPSDIGLSLDFYLA